MFEILLDLGPVQMNLGLNFCRNLAEHRRTRGGRRTARDPLPSSMLTPVSASQTRAIWNSTGCNYDSDLRPRTDNAHVPPPRWPRLHARRLAYGSWCSRRRSGPKYNNNLVPTCVYRRNMISVMHTEAADIRNANPHTNAVRSARRWAFGAAARS